MKYFNYKKGLITVAIAMGIALLLMGVAFLGDWALLATGLIVLFIASGLE